MIACHIHNQTPTAIKVALLAILFGVLIGLIILFVDIIRTTRRWKREDS